MRQEEIAIAHLMKVNEWERWVADVYLEVAWQQWFERSVCKWTQDFSWLEQFDIHVEPLKSKPLTHRRAGARIESSPTDGKK